MELTREQKKLGRKYNILRILSNDIENKRFSELQQLYEAANLGNNQKLLKQLYAKRNVGVSFLDMVYWDIMHILVEEIMDNSSMEDLFRDLYAKRFPKIKEVFSEMESSYIEKGQASTNKLTKIRGIEVYYFCYLAYDSNVFSNPDKFGIINFEKDMQYMDYSYYQVDRDFGNEFFKFNEEEPIFTSAMFTKYITKRKNELAEYLGIPTSELCSYIHNEMKSHDRDGESSDDIGGTPLRSGFVGTIEHMTKSIINKKNGGNFWYELVTNDQIKFEGLLKYVPDVESIICDYYKSFIKARYIEAKEKDGQFNKLTLSRECTTPSIEYDYSMILCMYEMDVLYKMFSTMMEKYYSDFSWEKITKRGIKERYEKIVDDLQGVIDKKAMQLEKLSRDNENLSLQITRDISKATAPLTSENNKLYRELEKQSFEIEKLKKQLRYQDEFINELNKKEEDINTDIQYDLDLLQSKKYLFVGRFEEALPELKHQFPNSIFMNSESASIAGIKVDAVVMLIKWMSHGMYYKVKASNTLSETQCIICNSKNKDIILKEIYNHIC